MPAAGQPPEGQLNVMMTTPVPVTPQTTPINLFSLTTIECAGASGISIGTLDIYGFVAGESQLSVAGAGTYESTGWDPCGTNNGVLQSDTFTGTVDPAISLSLTGNSPSTVNWVYDDTLYNQSSSLALLVGNWSMLDIFGDTQLFNIDLNGVVSGTSVALGCTIGGQIEVINQYYNLYTFNIHWTECPSGPYEHGFNINGLLYLDNTVTPQQLVEGAIVNDLIGSSISDQLFIATFVN